MSDVSSDRRDGHSTRITSSGNDHIQIVMNCDGTIKNLQTFGSAPKTPCIIEIHRVACVSQFAFLVRGIRAQYIGRYPIGVVLILRSPSCVYIGTTHTDQNLNIKLRGKEVLQATDRNRHT